MNLRATPNFDPNILNLSRIVGDLKANISKSLRESATLMRRNIKAELLSPNKTGTLRTAKKLRRSSKRRSAAGESLARDSGASERLISSQDIGSSSVEVGFKENPYGFDYVAYQELEKNRPTLENAADKSLSAINAIFDKNFTIK